jgi:hypothetical protein
VDSPKKRPKFRPDCHGLSWTVTDNSTEFDLLKWTVEDSHGPVRTTDTRLRIKRFGVRVPASALNDERLRKGPLIFVLRPMIHTSSTGDRWWRPDRWISISICSDLGVLHHQYAMIGTLVLASRFARRILKSAPSSTTCESRFGQIRRRRRQESPIRSSPQRGHPIFPPINFPNVLRPHPAMTLRNKRVSHPPRQFGVTGSTWRRAQRPIRRQQLSVSWPRCQSAQDVRCPASPASQRLHNPTELIMM